MLAATNTPYPDSPAEQSRWIVERRPPRNLVDARRPYAFLNELERASNGEIVPVSTLFLSNRECPFRCLMCDLWKHTLTRSVDEGDIAAQIEFALSQLPPALHVKLYNSGSFFDPRAIPPADYPAIIAQIRHFERVVVECHPSFIGERCFAFAKNLAEDGARLEVAMGLETANPEVLKRLNKGITLDSFRRAAMELRKRDIALRVFILVKPPFQAEDQALEWAKRSLDFAFDCGAGACCLIPTRDGNGALESLQRANQWSPPRLSTLESATDYGAALGRGRAFADLWDLERFSTCDACFDARRQRLEEMNFSQIVAPPVRCAACGDE